jgi:hypothetical protein
MLLAQYCNKEETLYAFSTLLIKMEHIMLYRTTLINKEHVQF